MDNKKVIETIEKKLEVKVEKVLEVKQDSKVVIVDVKVGEASYRKVVLKESKNQHSIYYRFVSASEYEMKVEAEPKKAEKNHPEAENKDRTALRCKKAGDYPFCRKGHQPGSRWFCPD